MVVVAVWVVVVEVLWTIGRTVWVAWLVVDTETAVRTVAVVRTGAVTVRRSVRRPTAVDRCPTERLRRVVVVVVCAVFSAKERDSVAFLWLEPQAETATALRAPTAAKVSFL